MDPEEVRKFLKDDAKGKALLIELTEDPEVSNALKEKNNELILSNKRLKREREEAVTKLKEAETKLEEFDGTEVSAAVEKATKKIIKERDDLAAKVTEYDSRIHKLVVQNGLNEALVKANVAKEHIPAVRALLLSENKIEIDETENVAKIGDKDLVKFVTEWSQGDVGKNYVSASQNGGGGAKGSGQSSTKTDDMMKLDPKARLIAAREAKL